MLCPPLLTNYDTLFQPPLGTRISCRSLRRLDSVSYSWEWRNFNRPQKEGYYKKWLAKTLTGKQKSDIISSFTTTSILTRILLTIGVKEEKKTYLFLNLLSKLLFPSRGSFFFFWFRGRHDRETSYQESAQSSFSCVNFKYWKIYQNKYHFLININPISTQSKIIKHLRKTPPQNPHYHLSG